jgi:hypothetical protein
MQVQIEVPFFGARQRLNLITNTLPWLPDTSPFRAMELVQITRGATRSSIRNLLTANLAAFRLKPATSEELEQLSGLLSHPQIRGHLAQPKHEITRLLDQ